jgi:glycine betaine/proline transport system ATP-binding protein
MQDELIELQSKVKKTIIFITHDLDESLKMGDRIVLMKDAKIVQIGTPEDILSNPSNSYVKKFLENVDYTKILTAEDVMIRPKAHCFSTEGPKTCLRRMQTHEFSGLFVVDKNHRLKGYITAELAAKLIKQNISKIEEYIELFEKQCVLPDTPIRELFSVMVDNRYPVAVVNDENKLRGIIVNGSIIASLAEGVDIND